MIRTHDAGALRADNVGQTVTLAGWVARRRDHGGVAFLDLREASGVVQVVVRDESVAHALRNEYCIKVTGEVSLRPEGNANPNLPSGEVEVIASDVEVLSPAAPLPFPIDDEVYGSHPRTSAFDVVRLGTLSPRGERAVLTVPIDTLMRVSCNPFYPYLAERLTAWTDAATQGSRSR